MSTQSKPSIKPIVLLALSAVMIGSAAIFGRVILAKADSRLFTHPFFYPSFWRCMTSLHQFK
jgi:hypothetical protein